MDNEFDRNENSGAPGTGENQAEFTQNENSDNFVGGDGAGSEQTDSFAYSQSAGSEQTGSFAYSQSAGSEQSDSFANNEGAGFEQPGSFAGSEGTGGAWDEQADSFANCQSAEFGTNDQGDSYGRSVNFEAGEYTDNAKPPKASAHKKKQRQPREPKYVTTRSFVLVLVIAIIISSCLGAGGFAIASNVFGSSSSSKTINTTNISLAQATGSELSIQEIIARNENSVVAIETESVSTDSWLGQYVTQGAGSGVIYSEDGYIITNNHVISGASSIKVTLHDGTELDASLVAADSQTDVAVIKVNKTGLTPVSFSDMNTVSVGDLAVAIGNPLGTLSGTATEGIISALEREITIDGKSMTLIQTSASINPGNSGGGLFDQYGNLIGLVVAKSSGSDVEGLGFAIPSDTVLSVAKSLIENGYVANRPVAGITIVDLTDASTAMQYGVDLTGVYIKEVTGSGAREAGLQAGDLVYYIDDTKVTSSAVLLKAIQSHEVGDTVTFTIVRNGDILKYDVKLQASSGNALTSGSSNSNNSQRLGN